MQSNMAFAHIANAITLIACGKYLFDYRTTLETFIEL